MKCIFASILLATVAAELAWGLTCFNATSMPNFDKSVFEDSMLQILLGTAKFEANDTLPNDAVLVDGCDACIRATIRVTALLKDVANSSMNASSDMSFLFTSAKMAFKLSFWGCAKDDKTSKASATTPASKKDPAQGEPKVDDLLNGNGIENLLHSAYGMKPGGDSCASSSIMVGIPASAMSGAIQLCTCCDDMCNADRTCGNDYQFREFIADQCTPTP